MSDDPHVVFGGQEFGDARAKYRLMIGNDDVDNGRLNVAQSDRGEGAQLLSHRLAPMKNINTSNVLEDIAFQHKHADMSVLPLSGKTCASLCC